MAKPGGASNLTRRTFLRATGAATGAAIAGGIPGNCRGAEGSQLPEGDEAQRPGMGELRSGLGRRVQAARGRVREDGRGRRHRDQINMNDLNPRIASAIETKAGPDIIMMISNWPHLYADGLADVDDLVEEIASGTAPAMSTT